MFPTKFQIIWLSGCRGEEFKKSTNQKQQLPVVTMFVNGSEQNCNLYRGPSIDASYQLLAHMVKWFQRRRIFLNRQIRNKYCLWRTCLLMDQDEMCNSYRGPSIDASYHVSFHLTKLFQSRRFLEFHQSETRTACGGHVC